MFASRFQFLSFIYHLFGKQQVRRFTQCLDAHLYAVSKPFLEIIDETAKTAAIAKWSKQPS